MAITVECTACQHPYTVPEQFVGKRVKCKKCGTVFTVEQPPPPALHEADPFAEAPFEPVREKKSEAPSPKWQVPVIATVEAAKAPVIANTDLRPSGPRLGSIGGAPAYILSLMLAVSVVAGVYLTVASYTQVKDSHAANVAVGHIWGWIIGADVLFFAVIGPLLLLGIWGTSQIFNFRMVDSAYWRACTVAAPPTVLLYLADALPSPADWVLRIAAIPVAFYLLKWLFNLDWITGLVGFIFSAFGWVAGLVLMTVVLGLIMVGNLSTISHDIEPPVAVAVTPTPPVDSSTDSNPSPDNVPNTPAKGQASALARFKDRLQGKANADLSHSAREDVLPLAKQLRQEAESLRPAFHDDPEWPNILGTLEQFEHKVAALPSNDIDPAIYTDAADAEDWTISKLSRGLLNDEVSFKQFKIQPPLDTQINLASSEDAIDGLTWNNIQVPTTSISVYTKPRKNSKQRRPVVSENANVLHAADEAGLYSIHAPASNATYGQISGLFATRVAMSDATQESQEVDYLVPISDEWLIVHLTFPMQNSAAGKVLEAAARTLRQADVGEARADPFAAKYIVSRLADDFEHVAPILRSQGPLAEDCAG